MGLDAQTMQHAIGLAATQVVGLREMFGSHAKSFHPGRAAQCGLLSAIMASKGFTSSLQALEAKRGWANAVSTSQALSKQVDSLGKEWEISENAFKPFPCGIVAHPIIDGCIQLHHELTNAGVQLSAIKTIHAKVHPLVLELTGKREPQDGLQGKFSVFHSGAAGLAFAKAGIAQYADSVVKDPLVVRLRDKIQATVDPALGTDETIVTVILEDGREFGKHVRHAIGSVEVPMTDKQLEEKFKDQAFLVLGDSGPGRPC
jgi:aconitate decarboxylase